jgi:chemotaxis signal transduction protein
VRGARVLFRVAGCDYALPLDGVVEVRAGGQPSLIPFVPREVGGVLNVRGEPLPVLDAGTLLRGEPSGASRHLIVLADGTRRVGVLTERVLHVDARIEDGEVDPQAPPAPLPLRWARDGDRRVAVVEPEALLARAATLLAARHTERRQGGERCPTAF